MSRHGHTYNQNKNAASKSSIDRRLAKAVLADLSRGLLEVKMAIANVDEDKAIEKIAVLEEMEAQLSEMIPLLRMMKK